MFLRAPVQPKVLGGRYSYDPIWLDRFVKRLPKLWGKPSCSFKLKYVDNYPFIA
jgi:hypothetical protein